MASWYTAGLKAVMEGSVNLLSDTVNVALVKGTYSPSKSHASFAASVASHEASGAGYTAGGVELTGKSVGAQSNKVTFDAADTVINGLTADFRYVVIYSGDTLLGYMDLGAQSIQNKNLTIKWEYSEEDPVTGEYYSDSGLLRGTA